MKSLNMVKPDLNKRCDTAQKGAQTGPNNAMLDHFRSVQIGLFIF